MTDNKKIKCVAGNFYKLRNGDKAFVAFYAPACIFGSILGVAASIIWKGNGNYIGNENWDIVDEWHEGNSMIEVTDEMARLACEVYGVDYNDNVSDMKKALEAVFKHIQKEECQHCKVPEKAWSAYIKDGCACCIVCDKQLLSLEKQSANNAQPAPDNKEMLSFQLGAPIPRPKLHSIVGSPEYKADQRDRNKRLTELVEQMASNPKPEPDNEGWITWRGIKPSEPSIEIKYNDGEVLKFNPAYHINYDHVGIEAYRIIKEDTPDKEKCSHKEFGECGDGVYLCEICGKMAWKKVEPKEEVPTFEEYCVSQEHNFDILTPSEIIQLNSEYLHKYMARKE